MCMHHRAGPRIEASRMRSNAFPQFCRLRLRLRELPVTSSSGDSRHRQSSAFCRRCGQSCQSPARVLCPVSCIPPESRLGPAFIPWGSQTPPTRCLCAAACSGGDGLAHGDEQRTMPSLPPAGLKRLLAHNCYGCSTRVPSALSSTPLPLIADRGRERC
jgi:hypothetical protein